MKDLRIMGVVLAIVLLLCPLCRAANTATSKDLPVTVNVGQELELSGWIKEMSASQTDPGTEGTLRDFPSTMALGTLTSELGGGADAGCLYASTWYAVFLVARTSGRTYRIQSVATSLNGYGNAAGYSLPDTAFVLTPAYSSADEWVWNGGSEPQGDDPNSGSTVGDQSSAVGTHDIYNSGSGGASRIIRAFYSIPPYPGAGDPPHYSGWSPVTKDQRYGPYEGSVTISMVLTGT